MAGGTSPVALMEAPVIGQECNDLMDKVRERWQHPYPIPGWCCDGIHCAGTDVRFAGILPQMYAVCLAFSHYGRVDPNDEWLPEFMCFDGLTIDYAPVNFVC